MKLAWEAAGITDVGLMRAANEDAFLVDAPRGVFLVADGMGGHAAGEVASAIATEAVGGALRRGVDAGLRADALAESMAEAFRLANHAILGWTAEHPATRGMGTTCTSLVVCDDGTFRAAHIGDSRMYVVREGELAQVSRDHTWVQQEVDAGRLSERAARTHRLAHVLTRALGAELDEPDVYSGTFLPGDVVLLCTDGLTGMLGDRILRRVLVRPDPLPELLATLVDGANRRGGRDNITAVIVRMYDPDPTAERIGAESVGDPVA